MISPILSPFFLLIAITSALTPHSLPSDDIFLNQPPLSNPKSKETIPQHPSYHYPILSPRQQPISFPVQQQNKSRFLRPQAADVRDGLNGTLLVDYLGYWFTNITIGTQILPIILDTGSADLWVLSPSLPPNTTNGLPTYDPTTSTTATLFTNETFNISYGEGGNGVSGPVYFDTATLPPFTVPHQAIGSATKDLGFYPGEVGSGILGLAFKRGNSIRPEQRPTFMELLQDSLDEPVMTADFRLDGSGTFGFGMVDREAFGGDLVRVGIDNVTKYPGSWSVENVTYVANGVELGVFDIVFGMYRIVNETIPLTEFDISFEIVRNYKLEWSVEF